MITTEREWKKYSTRLNLLGQRSLAGRWLDSNALDIWVLSSHGWQEHYLPPSMRKLKRSSLVWRRKSPWSTRDECQLITPIESIDTGFQKSAIDGVLSLSLWYACTSIRTHITCVIYPYQSIYWHFADHSPACRHVWVSPCLPEIFNLELLQMW
jgi:hypothetical protein